MPKLDAKAGGLAHSSRIAEGLLAVLAETGDAAARTRAIRALGSQASLVHGAGGWIGTEPLADMLRAAQVDERLARRVGQATVRPHGVGLALCYGGLATTEKAYRRVDHLLARECIGARYEPLEIEGGGGRVRFHPPKGERSTGLSDPAGRLVCAARLGMLESIPLLYGLVPARVRETRCLYQGARHCEYEVSWSRSPRSGLIVGGALGVAMGLGLVAAGLLMGWPVWPLAIAAPLLALIAAGAGRSIDLARQLEAVAGARRGHLALLDQLDSALAERMDELAKLTGTAPVSARRELPDDEEATGLVPVDHRERRDRRDRRERRETDADEPDEAPAHVDRDVDLRERIEAAIETLRPEWPAALEVDLELEEDVPVVSGDPEQLDFVLTQLLRNAATASIDASLESGDEPELAMVSVALRASPAGVEVTIEDHGEGIDPELLDKAFDPFNDDAPAGRDGGLGLPVCGRIVERHGGELRVQSGGEGGTRVAIVLPA